MNEGNDLLEISELSMGMRPSAKWQPKQSYVVKQSCSHKGDVDHPLVAEACRPEVYALLLAKLEILAAALARQEGGKQVRHDAHLSVLEVQPALRP